MLRLPRRRHRQVTSSIDAAVRAREDANDRLTAVRDMIAVQRERARAERVTIIAALKKMRQQDNLARMLLDTVEKETGGGGEASSGADG